MESCSYEKVKDVYRNLNGVGLFFSLSIELILEWHLNFLYDIKTN